MANFTLRPLYLQGNRLRNPCSTRLGGRFWEYKTSWLRSARNQTTAPWLSILYFIFCINCAVPVRSLKETWAINGSFHYLLLCMSIASAGQLCIIRRGRILPIFMHLKVAVLYWRTQNSAGECILQRASNTSSSQQPCDITESKGQTHIFWGVVSKEIKHFLSSH